MAIYAFDGTWQEDDDLAEVAQEDSNIPRFLDACDLPDEELEYVAGVGTRFSLVGRAIGAQDTSYLVSIMSLAMVGAKLFFGSMADRWDHRVLMWMVCAALIVAFVMLLGEINIPIVTIQNR